MATPEPRWGVIPLVDGWELMRREGVRVEDGRPTLVEISLAVEDPEARRRSWRIEHQIGDDDPAVIFPATLASVVTMVGSERYGWTVHQTMKWLDELAARIRDVLLGGLYVEAARAMREFQSHITELQQVEGDSAEISEAVARGLSRETRVVPLDDLSHSVVCLAQVDTLDGQVLVEGVRDEDDRTPMVEVRDTDPYPDPFSLKLMTAEAADALWAAVYGARVVVWGEPTPFTSRS